ncbi:MAG: polymer-forming cytoskeletal protein [Chitinophagales bacterium]
MFGNKNSEERKDNNSKGSKSLNQFGEGTVITGEIKSKGDIRIDGEINGAVYSEAKLVVGPSGKVDGDVKCKNADISGKVYGRLIIEDLLFLKSSAVIEGDIVAQKMVVESGAMFNGTCSMGESIKANKNEEKSAAKLKKEVV